MELSRYLLPSSFENHPSVLQGTLSCKQELIYLFEIDFVELAQMIGYW